MKRLLGFFLLSAAAFAAEPRPALFADIGQIESELSSITGLEFKRRVPYAVINRNELRRFLDERIKDSIKPDEIRAEELTLKMLGLLPQDFDLRKTTVDLLTEQAAAFYDYHKKKLFILENETGAEARMALVHEMAHALADQHFRLDKYIRDGSRSDDDQTARLAVMEGQASWLMSAYMAKQAGGPAEVPEAVLKVMQRSLESGADQYPVFAQAPLYIRESLVFPYSQGLAFQDAVFRKMGQDGFSLVFRRAPVSTQQILHPDKYLDQTAPDLPRLPRLPSSKGFRTLASGTLGELDFRLLLTQYLEKADAEPAAAHFAGGVYELLEHKREKYPVLAFASTWDSEESAKNFFQLYQRVLAKKWKKLEVEPKTGATSLEGRGDSGYFRVWLEAATVTSIEGWQSPLR